MLGGEARQEGQWEDREERDEGESESGKGRYTVESGRDAAQK